MILSATGHRPDKLGGYSVVAVDRLRRFAREQLQRLQPGEVVSGMALGWDQAVAAACVDLGVPFTAAVPFVEQPMAWPHSSRVEYARLLQAARHIHVVSPGGYAPEKMLARNMWMMENSDCVLALYNGSPGGTSHCVNYARRCGCRVDNVWPLWEDFR